MTLRLAQDGKVVATGLREAFRNSPKVTFATVHRENGLLLRSVSFRSTPRETPENATQERTMLDDWEQSDDIVAAASSCPVPDCGSLVIDYRPVGSVRQDHPEDWEFTCSRCGMEFTVTQGELIFQSVPKQWLSANIPVTWAERTWSGKLADP
jgi:hypothetical protein